MGGRTGRASCNHLHFETRFQGKAFNPKELINFDSYSLLSDTFNVTKTTYGLSRDYLPTITSSETVADIESENVNPKAEFANKAKSSKSSKSSKSKKYHTIKSGDTLSAVSRKYNVSVKQLCSINGIKPSKTLQLGTKIRVQ